MLTLQESISKQESEAMIVYIVAESVSGEYTGMVKVGISKNYQSLGRRLSNLQSGNPRKLEVVHTQDYTLPNQAYRAEQSMHKAFAFVGYGLTNEWFNVNQDELLVVKMYLSAQEGAK